MCVTPAGIGWGVGGTQEDEILEFAISEFNFAEYGVIERGTAAVRNGEPHRCSLRCRLSLQSFGRIQLSASAFILGGTALLCGFGPAALQFLFAAETIV